jgi:hypothetical protein
MGLYITDVTANAGHEWSSNLQHSKETGVMRREKFLERNFNRITNVNTSNSFGQKSETPEDGL